MTTPNAHLMQASTHIRDPRPEDRDSPEAKFIALCGAGAPWPTGIAFVDDICDATCKICQDRYDALAEKDWESRNMIDIDPDRYAE
jgi:hypothetical protein